MVMASVIRFTAIDTRQIHRLSDCRNALRLMRKKETISHPAAADVPAGEGKYGKQGQATAACGADGLAIITRMWFINFIEIFRTSSACIIIAGFDWRMAVVILAFLVTYYLFP